MFTNTCVTLLFNLYEWDFKKKGKDERNSTNTFYERLKLKCCRNWIFMRETTFTYQTMVFLFYCK